MTNVARVELAPLRGFIDIVSAYRLSKMLKGGNIVVHVHNFKDAFTAVFARIISHEKNVRVVITRHLIKKAKTSAVYQWLYKQVDAIVFVSELARTNFLSPKPKIAMEKLKVVHNSIEGCNHSYSDIDLRKQYALTDDSVIAMYHGRLAKEKGVHLLIEAMKSAKHDNLFLFLVGSGSDDYVSKLKQLINDNNLTNRVFMTGFVENVYGIIAQCDFGVVPSIVEESFSLSCLEYICMGKPIITSNNGGQAEYLTDGETALLVPPEDIIALTNAIDRLTENKELIEKMGKRGKIIFADKLNYSKFYNSIIQIYNAE